MYYNNKREVFPSSIIANMFNFAPATSWEVESPEAKKAVKVSFG
jgi:LemA protein